MIHSKAKLECALQLAPEKKGAYDAIVLTAAAIWIVALGFAASHLLRYDYTPGESEHPPDQWPAASGVVRNPLLPTLVVALHPKCPCSLATVGELNRIMTHCQNRVSVVALMMKPAELDDDWVKSELWSDLERIPGVVLTLDPDGVEAAKFGAKASGTVFLFDKKGVVLFSGGITDSRGHIGENAGTRAIISGIETGCVSSLHTLVFGCALSDTPAESAGASEQNNRH